MITPFPPDPRPRPPASQVCANFAPMPRIVRGGLIQVKADISLEGSTDDIKTRMIDKHLPLIEDAGRKGVQVLCLQELFYGPYFCAEQKTRWYDLTEQIPDGPTTRMFQEHREASRHGHRPADLRGGNHAASTTTPPR